MSLETTGRQKKQELRIALGSQKLVSHRKILKPVNFHPRIKKKQQERKERRL